MDGLLPGFSHSLGSSALSLTTTDVESIVLSLILAFVIGQLIAWVYQWTHSGMSYSRTFTQSLVLLTMIVSLVMFIIGDSIITAFGLIGALAIIRFRNVLKDTRDTTFIFFSLVLGMALGSQRYLPAILGTLALMAVTLYLNYTSFGSRDLFDGHLSCRLKKREPGEERADLMAVMSRFCHRIKRVSVRQVGGMTEIVFQIRLRDRRRGQDMIHILESLPGVNEVSLVLRDELAEA